MKNIDNNNYLTEEQLNEFTIMKKFRDAFTAFPRIWARSKSKNPFLKQKADQLKNGYKNKDGDWIPGYKDRHPVYKVLPYVAAPAGYYGTKYTAQEIYDLFTNTDFGPSIETENNSTIKGDGNVIVESGEILETLYNLETVVAILNEEEVQTSLNEVLGPIARVLNSLKGVAGRSATNIGGKMINRGEILKPRAITPSATTSKLKTQQKKAEVWNRKFKDEQIPDADGLPIDNPKFLPGYTDFDLQKMLSINKDSLVKKGLTPFIAGGEAYIAFQTIPPIAGVVSDYVGLTDIIDLGVMKWDEVERYLRTHGNRQSFGMDPDITNETLADSHDIVLDEFSNVICEADMIPDDTMRNYIDIINGNSLNEGVLSWVANKLAASPKKFSSDDFDELLKDTDVTVIVKTRDRLAQSIQNAGADPALSNEIKTLDNIISQRINNSRK
jgi:hypothetical protein